MALGDGVGGGGGGGVPWVTIGGRGGGVGGCGGEIAAGS